MGQRSQIYVRYENRGWVKGQRADGHWGFIAAATNKSLIARYYQWNYGERMISRAAHSIAWLKESAGTLYGEENKAIRILDTNFDMCDVQISSDIIQEWKEWGNADTFREDVFEEQDNNNGQLFIDVDLEGNIKYAFTHPYAKKEVLTATEYMQEDFDDWETSEYISDDGKQTCRENLAWIEANATLMTDEELEEFKNYDYKIEKPQKEQTVDNEIEML